MNTVKRPPSPAIVSQEAVRALPRWVLAIVCIAYVLAGFIGREPWKGADITALGVMIELASGHTDWWGPQLYGQRIEASALLPYWLGAWAIQIAPAWVDIDIAARVPFALLLALTMSATWYGTYYLARMPAAQPVAFAFGGEANPVDYARSLADGSLLALLAMLGLAQLSHETTPSVAQLACAALLFYAVAASWVRTWVPAIAFVFSIFGLALSGAPAFGLAMALAGAGVRTLGVCGVGQSDGGERAGQSVRHAYYWAILVAAASVAAIACAYFLGQWQARIGQWPTSLDDWRRLAQLWVWFTWPAWPLALLALWRWRRHWQHLHISWPAALIVVIVVATCIRPGADRTLFLALPAFACLAAMALPTLHRSVSALVDWFTLLFFSFCGVVIWGVYASLQWGFPAKPAQNVRRLLPGFENHFSAVALVIALLATAIWIGMLSWRIGRHRAALWKSLVLPASGTVVCWVLLTTLWMPILDQGRSYAPTVKRLVSFLNSQGYRPGDCVAGKGLSQAQQVALRLHGALAPVTPDRTDCAWLIADAQAIRGSDLREWQPLQSFRRRGSADSETLVVYSRTSP